MNLRTIIMLSIIAAVQCFPLISVISDNGYWLIVYCEEEDLQPGDLGSIKAELYCGGKLITRSIVMNITIRIFKDVEYVFQEQTLMRYKGKGLFTYSFTVPSYDGGLIPTYFNYLRLNGRVSAYINGKVVETNYFSFTLNIKNPSNQEPESNSIQPFHTITPTEAALGDIIQVITYISQVKKGEIDPNYVNITVEFHICTSNGIYINNTYNKIRSTYHAEGYFLTYYTIPSSLALNHTYVWGRYLIIDIFTNYSGWDPFDCNLVDKRTISIGRGFNIITKYNVHENQIDYHILMLNYDFQPVSNVSFSVNLTFHYYNGEIFEKSPIFPNNTNNEGRSTFTIQINSNIRLIVIAIHATKGNLSYDYDFGIQPFIQEDDNDDNEFHVSPTMKSLEYYYSYYDQGYWVEYQALINNQPICNQEIVCYVGWKKGMIQISTETTDSTGCFKLLFHWPSNFQLLETSLEIVFSYYNGTSWLNFNDYFYFHFYFYLPHNVVEPEFITIQENLALSTEIINYSDYQILNFSCNLPSKYINSRSGELLCRPAYKNTILGYNYEPDTFYHYQSFSYPDGIPPSGVVQASCLIDTSKELEFIIVGLYLLDEMPSTCHRLVWSLNPDGTLRELPEPPAKPLVNLDPKFVELLGRTTLFIIVLAACIGVIWRTKHRS